MRDGLRLALTTFTIVPLRGGRVDRAAARVAMALGPLVGVLLGLVLGGVALGLRALHAPGIVPGGVVVAVGALLTRGLHLDGLADTVDGLGSYAGRDRALEIMRSPDVGPLGVVALVLTVLIQAGGVAAGAVRGPVAAAAGLAAALLLLAHARRRLGGITGDVLGALVEVGQTVTLVGLVLG